MSQLQIKTESFPKRCEVCHQADFFDPKRNHCSRCAGIAIRQNRETASVKSAESYAPSEGFEFFLGLVTFFFSGLGLYILADYFVDPTARMTYSPIEMTFSMLGSLVISSFVGRNRPLSTIGCYITGMVIGLFPLYLILSFFGYVAGHPMCW